MRNILLIDATENIEMLEFLTLLGNTVCVQSIESAQLALSKHRFDLVISEVTLHQQSMLDFFEKNSQGNDKLFWIFYTSKDDIYLKVKVFELGAQDYILKQFNPLEVQARIKAGLRIKPRFSEIQATLECGDLLVSIAYQRVYWKQVQPHAALIDLCLTPTEFRLFYFFLIHEDEILSRAQLLEVLWSQSEPILERTIDKHISTLKKKLMPSCVFLQSIHSKGYRFTTQTKGLEGHEPGLSAEI